MGRNQDQQRRSRPHWGGEHPSGDDEPDEIDAGANNGNGGDGDADGRSSEGEHSDERDESSAGSGEGDHVGRTDGEAGVRNTGIDTGNICNSNIARKSGENEAGGYAKVGLWERRLRCRIPWRRRGGSASISAASC